MSTLRKKLANPILVFDSGVGGLTVLAEIRNQLPNHHYVYLFDNARLPYGELEEQVLKAGAVELITAVARETNAALVVVACNTASTTILPELRTKLNIPVVGVVPAIKPASEQTKSKHIALLATPATICREYTKDLIDSFALDCKVELIASSELVEIAEAKLQNKAVQQYKIDEIVKPIVNSDIDTLVLGCTHFPLLKEELKKSLGNEVKLLDSGVAIANRVTYLLSTVTASRIREGEVIGIHTTRTLSKNLTSTLKRLGFTNISSLMGSK